MEITSSSGHIYAGEHNSRKLDISVDNEYADKTVRLSFITPAGRVYLSEALTLTNCAGEYLLPCALLDANGVLQAQIEVTDNSRLCAKSRIYCFEVERSVGEGEAFDGDALISLSDIYDKYLTIQDIVETAEYIRTHVDTQLNSSSGDPIANSAVTAALSGKADKSNTVLSTYLSLGRKSGTTAGTKSTALGNNVTASGSYSHAEGSSTTASSSSSHAEGSSTTASSTASHAEGYSTAASGAYSHAEGNSTTASTTSAHAEGSSTTASGNSSHAEGYSATAGGTYSHAEGQGTKAMSSSQHAQGKYNVADSVGAYSHIVGNGASDSSRSNAHTLDWSGNAWYAGKMKLGGTGYSDGSEVLTEADIDLTDGSDRYRMGIENGLLYIEEVNQ